MSGVPMEVRGRQEDAGCPDRKLPSKAPATHFVAPELRPSLQSRGSLAPEASITVCPHGQQWRQQFRGYGRQLRTHEVRACPTVDQQHVGPIHVDSVGLLSGCGSDILSVSLPPGHHLRLSPLH